MADRSPNRNSQHHKPPSASVTVTVTRTAVASVMTTATLTALATTIHMMTRTLHAVVAILTGSLTSLLRRCSD
eukprot:scaffold678646_cov45-Prasinocladus_malaysianus.AAC.1